MSNPPPPSKKEENDENKQRREKHTFENSYGKQNFCHIRCFFKVTSKQFLSYISISLQITKYICSPSLTLIWRILSQFTLATCRLIKGHRLCLFGLYDNDNLHISGVLTSDDCNQEDQDN